MNLEDHLRALCLILSMMRLNKSFFFLQNNSCKPRYLSFPLFFCIPSSFLALSFALFYVFVEKVVAEFLFLKQFHISSRLISILGSYGSLIYRKNILSSAMSKWFTLGFLFKTLIPCNFLSCWALLHRPKSTSLQRLKMYGEK